MTYKDAYMTLASPAYYSLLELRAAALFIIRYGKHAHPSDVIKAKKILKGDVARQRERASTEAFALKLRRRDASRRRRALRKTGLTHIVEALRAKAETGADHAEIARIEAEIERVELEAFNRAGFSHAFRRAA